MLNILALFTGFIASFIVFLPRPQQEEKRVAKGVLIQAQQVSYHPSPTLTENIALVLAETDEQETVNGSPEPTATPSPTNTPTPAPTIPVEATPDNQQNTSNPGSFIMNQINEYRVASGLVPFETHPLVCGFAQTRVSELLSSFSHSGFDQRIGNNTLPYPSYTKVAENIADASSYTRVLNMWQTSSGHNRNLLSDSKYACVAGSQRLFVFESWTP